MYVERNLERGYNRKELGVSASKMLRINLNRQLTSMK
jgi:hypothetical protein